MQQDRVEVNKNWNKKRRKKKTVTDSHLDPNKLGQLEDLMYDKSNTCIFSLETLWVFWSGEDVVVVGPILPLISSGSQLSGHLTKLAIQDQ